MINNFFGRYPILRVQIKHSRYQVEELGIMVQAWP
jgi:hypothetical protein